MLLEQTIQILQLGARAQRDALFARAVQQVRVAALGGGHGVDNGLHAFEHFGVDLGLGLLRHLPHARQFIEHAEVFDNLYGTSLQEMERITAAGQQMILEIDWQGALQVKAKMPQARLVFILPPSLNSLRERLINRGQDDAATVERRHAGALTEIAQCIHFDYLLINDNFDEALAGLETIVFDDAAEFTRVRQSQRHQALIDQLTATNE